MQRSLCENSSVIFLVLILILLLFLLLFLLFLPVVIRQEVLSGIREDMMCTLHPVESGFQVQSELAELVASFCG
jgi:hypothetical protein